MKYDDYKNYFRDQGQFIVCFIADVVDTDFEYIYHENIQLKTPTINIEVSQTWNSLILNVEHNLLISISLGAR